MTAEHLSRQWRGSQRDFLPQRRIIAALALAEMTCLGVVALYQLGLIPHVPQPRLSGLDADAVNGSAQAYSIAETPDAVVGMAAASSALALTACGDADRYRTRPWLPLALTAQTAAGAIFAAKLLVDQPTKHHNVSLWSMLAGLSVMGMAAASLPEARSAATGIFR